MRSAASLSVAAIILLAVVNSLAAAESTWPQWRGQAQDRVASAGETGQTIWQTQLPKSRIDFTSSPLVAGNHLYVTSENATTYVIGPLDHDQPDIVSINPLADSDPFTVASPVPVDGSGLLLRTRHRLYRINGE